MKTAQRPIGRPDWLCHAAFHCLKALPDRQMHTSVSGHARWGDPKSKK